MKAREIAEMDFSRADHTSADYDVAVDGYVGEHFMELSVLDLRRVSILEAFKDRGYLMPVEGGRLQPSGVSAKSMAAMLSGWKSRYSRFTRSGRGERLAAESLRQELLLHGSVRVRLLPETKRSGS